jgi:predicted AAA+ superfamily ATPase
MIERDLTSRLKKAARQMPAITLTGPRQSGKSTLCRSIFPDHPYANLEAADVRAFAQHDPRAFLAQSPRGAIIDEVQRAPELPSYLLEIIDADPKPGRWILTGSQNLFLLQSISQSLAGRTAVLNLLPLARSEVIRFQHHPQTPDESILAGGYPRIFDQRLDAYDWLGAYLTTYIERDVRTITNVGDLATFQRFVDLCGGRTSQLLNLSILASDAGISQPTAKAWMSVLETSFIVFRLPSFSGNIRKRLVKMPRLHFHDTGLVCRLLGIRSVDQLRIHPLRGAIFETWVVSEILKHRLNRGESGGIYFYRDQNGVESDLVIEHANHLTLVEAKAGQTVTGDMLAGVRRVIAAVSEYKPCRAVVVYAGQTMQRRSDVSLVPWSQIHEIDWTQP